MGGGMKAGRRRQSKRRHRLHFVSRTNGPGSKPKRFIGTRPPERSASLLPSQPKRLRVDAPHRSAPPLGPPCPHSIKKALPRKRFPRAGVAAGVMSPPVEPKRFLSLALLAQAPKRSASLPAEHQSEAVAARQCRLRCLRKCSVPAGQKLKKRSPVGSASLGPGCR